MPKTITTLPVRACPFPDCQCTWVEDDQMYEDLNRCPACGRDVTTFSYGVNPDEGLPIPAGGSKRPLHLRFVTKGPMRFVEEPNGFILTAGSYSEPDYRR